MKTGILKIVLLSLSVINGANISAQEKTHGEIVENSLKPGGKTLAQSPYTLKGLIMDESDNLLADIKVTLEPHSIETRCDPNGNFTLEVDPYHSANSNTTYTLKAEEIGYQDASIEITSQQLASGLDDIVLELTTNPISGDVLGFAVHMGGEDVDSTEETTAWFHVYIPDAVDNVRAAFYVSRHGIGDITREDMQRFATEEEIALVAFFGTPVQRGIEPVSIVDEYIDSLAVLSGHPELPGVPIMTFGHSNGTGFAASWPRDRPEQCIAWMSYHPGFTDYLQYKNTDKIPSMVMVGSVDGYFNPEYDPTEGRRGSRQDLTVYSQRENYNAAMNVMVEGGVGHHPNDHDATWGFIYEYLRAAMRIRLADDGTLNNIDIESGSLGSHYDLDMGGRQMLYIDSYADYSGNKNRANWFPDQQFAQLWQCYGASAKLCSPQVTGVSLTPASDSLFIGSTLQLSAIVSPSDAAHKNVSYSSNSSSIASVNPNGIVSASEIGTTTITITTEDGAYQDSCLVSVLPIPVTGLSLTPASESLLPGDTLQLTTIISPSNATYQGVSFSSTDTTVAKVDTVGLINAIEPGTATITVTTEDGAFSDYCDLVIDDTTNTSSVLESAISSFDIFPNPANRLIDIEIPNTHDARYVIVNYLGQTVLSGEIYKGAATINISKLISSVYLVKVKAENEIYSGKLIKN